MSSRSLLWKFSNPRVTSSAISRRASSKLFGLSSSLMRVMIARQPAREIKALRWWILLAPALLAAGCGGGGAKPSACAVDRGAIPAWARAGFSDPQPRAPHVVGDSGRIAAILFGDPLVAPPAKDRANKILWVAKHQESGDLRIRARRDGQVLERTVPGGPGPSIVDLPAGCWRLTLTWAGGSDTLDLGYAQGKPS